MINNNAKIKQHVSKKFYPHYIFFNLFFENGNFPYPANYLSIKARNCHFFKYFYKKNIDTVKTYAYLAYFDSYIICRKRKRLRKSQLITKQISIE